MGQINIEKLQTLAKAVNNETYGSVIKKYISFKLRDILEHSSLASDIEVLLSNAIYHKTSHIELQMYVTHTDRNIYLDINAKPLESNSERFSVLSNVLLYSGPVYDVSDTSETGYTDAHSTIYAPIFQDIQNYAISLLPVKLFKTEIEYLPGTTQVHTAKLHIKIKPEFYQDGKGGTK